MTPLHIAPDLADNPKIRDLQRRLGAASISLIFLWGWAKRNRPDGGLEGLPTDEIEKCANWQGAPGAFVGTLAELRLLDGRPGSYRIHDFHQWNPTDADPAGGEERLLLRAQEPPPESLIEFPCVGYGAKVFHVTREQVAAWAEAFPGVDVTGELRKAKVWVAAHPARRKTARGMPQFLVSWLSRTQDKFTAPRCETREERRERKLREFDAEMERREQEREARAKPRLVAV